MKSKQTDNGYKLACVQSVDGPRMVPYKLERSPRVKRMYLQFDSPQYVTLKLPMRSSERNGLRFIQEHGDWICQALDRQPRAEHLQQYLIKHPRIALSGRWYKLDMCFQQGAFGYVVDDDAYKVNIALNAALPPEDQLIDILKRIARERLPLRVRYWSEKTGIKSHGVTIRDQKSRWGSCSETGGISLNWRLILIAPKLQDHVLLHELAHIRHFDHSGDFHAFLLSLDPRSETHSKQLHDGATRVFSLGRS